MHRTVGTPMSAEVHDRSQLHAIFDPLSVPRFLLPEQVSARRSLNGLTTFSRFRHTAASISRDSAEVSDLAVGDGYFDLRKAGSCG